MSASDNRFTVQNVNSSDAAPLAFFLFLVLGAILVGMSKWLEFPLWAVIGAPVVAMGGYALCAWKLPRFELRRDQLGDNLYYLGFLLTLVSLTVTLIQFSSNRESDYIISNFGVALVATILGITGRTLLGQMRKDTAAVERDMQASLGEASANLRGQISTSLEDFATFHKTMEQITKESARNVSEAHKALAVGLSSSVDEITSALFKQVEASRQAIEMQTNSFNESIEERSKMLSENITAVTDQLTEAISTHSHNIKSVSELNRVAIQDLVNVKIDASALSKIQEEIDSFSSMTIGSLKLTAEANRDNLDLSMHSIDSLNDVIDKLQSKLAVCTSEIHASSSAINGFSSATRALQSAIVHLELDSEKSKDKTFDSTSDLSKIDPNNRFKES